MNWLKINISTPYFLVSSRIDLKFEYLLVSWTGFEPFNISVLTLTSKLVARSLSCCSFCSPLFSYVCISFKFCSSDVSSSSASDEFSSLCMVSFKTLWTCCVSVVFVSSSSSVDISDSESCSDLSEDVMDFSSSSFDSPSSAVSTFYVDSWIFLQKVSVWVVQESQDVCDE